MGVDVQKLKPMPQRMAQGTEAPILALRKVLLKPLHSCFKLVGYY